MLPPRRRAVQIGAGHRIPAFDVAERDVACMAQESSDALSARPVLPSAARVIMVHVDELPCRKRFVAHRAGVVLRRQNEVELLLGEPVTRNSVLPVGFLARLPRLAMRVGARVLPLALHDLGRFARSAVARRARTHRPLSRHPLTAQIPPHTPRVISGLSDFCCDTPRSSHSSSPDPGSQPVLEPVRSHRAGRTFERVGALGFEPRTSRL
jgi:hypothetical protein